MKVHIWRVLLSESQELVDQSIERGESPSPTEIVDRVLAANRFVLGIEHYRDPLGEEVGVYLESSQSELLS